MSFEIWHIWLIASIFFFLLEIFLPSFFMASIGFGCLLSFFASLLGASTSLQIIIFCAGLIVSFIGIRPLMMHYMYKASENVKTNFEGIVGKTGIVSETIDSATNSGRVNVDGDNWKAISRDDIIIPEGVKIRVSNINSIVLEVVPLKAVTKKTEHTESPDTVQVVSQESPQYFMIKIGDKKINIPEHDIVCFCSELKTTYAITKEGKRYILDYSLNELEEKIDKEFFFRANRQCILSRSVIKSFTTGPYNKLFVFMDPEIAFHQRITVSRLKSPHFRKWIKR